MTEKVTKIGTCELNIVRVTCHRCGLTTEMDISRITKAISSSGACNHCSEQIIRFSELNPLLQLKRALEQINDSKETLTVEFAIVEDEPSK